MCLFPRLIKNKAYSKQRFLAIGTTIDERKKYVAVGCGKCIECKQQKAQQWRVRLCEEMKVQKYSKFITLTFTNESLDTLTKEFNTTECNGIATAAVRRFLERYRKKYKKTLRHWLITELGHENTERIHLHGIIFPEHDINVQELTTLWKYGRTDIGEYCNERTINYIVKYVTKLDIDHKNYEPCILCSAGIGKAFIETITAKNTYRYIKGKSAEYYTLKDGHKVALPIYYRNKLYSEKERADLWTDRLDKAEIYVNGIRIRNIDTAEGQKLYFDTLKDLQQWNNLLGYGNTSEEWKKEEYNITFKMLQRCSRRSANEGANIKNKPLKTQN